MELTITSTVFIDIDYLVNMVRKEEWKYIKLDEIVHDFVSRLDDCDYYLIGPEEEKQIKAELEKRLKNLKK